MLCTITEANDETSTLVATISDACLRDPAMDDWTGKDVLAHLAWWQDHSARLSEDVRAGRQPDAMSHPGATTDEINERLHREHVDESTETTRCQHDGTK
jgi:hypothetical protein